MSSNRQITYSTSSANELLTCTNYLAANDPGYRIFLVASFAILICVLGLLQAGGVPIPFSQVFLVVCLVIVMPVVANSLMVWGLVRDPRNCTTSFNEHGVTDHTEKSSQINLPWNSIAAIKINQGSVYFFGWRRSVYVPAYAFASLGEATDFYHQAFQLWREARDKKVANRITAVDDVMALEADTISRIQEFDAQEEAMWAELEEQHKKQQES